MDFTLFFSASILHNITDTDNVRVGPCISDLTLLNDAFKRASSLPGPRR